MLLCPCDPGFIFQGLKKHPWAHLTFLPYSFKGGCSTFSSVSSTDDAALMAFGQMLSYKAAIQMATILILIKCPVLPPVKSMSKFSMSSMGAGSDSDHSSLWWDVLLSYCPACKQMYFHAWCQRWIRNAVTLPSQNSSHNWFFPSYKCLSVEGN